jgi:hypothetical protein
VLSLPAKGQFALYKIEISRRRVLEQLQQLLLVHYQLQKYRSDWTVVALDQLATGE